MTTYLPVRSRYNRMKLRRSTKWVFTAILMVVGTIRVSVRAQQPDDDNTNHHFGCALCADGSVPNVDATIGETSCRAVANAISQTPATTDLCIMTQLQGYIYCNCPTYPTDSYCSLCSSSSSSSSSSTTNATTTDTTTTSEEYYYNPIPTQNRNLIIPDTNLTCGEAEFLKRDNINSSSSVSSSCATRLPDSAAEYCGCTSRTKKTCFLCQENNDDIDDDDDDDGNNTMASMRYVNRLLPPLFTTSCGSLDRWIGAVLSDENECRGTNTTIDVWFQTIPVPVQEYCGCPSSSSLNASQPPENTATAMCQICNDTQSVRHPNATITIKNNNNNNDDSDDDDDNDIDVRITCADLEIVTNMVMSNDTYCTKVSTLYESVCCQDPPAKSRTPSPAQSPSNANEKVPTTTTTMTNDNTASNNTSSSSSSKSRRRRRRRRHHGQYPGETVATWIATTWLVILLSQLLLL